MPANLENSAVVTGLENVNFHSNPKERKCRECSSTTALISHTSKIMLKTLQPRLQQYVNHELPDAQAGFRKGRGTKDPIANIHWIIKKARAAAAAAKSLQSCPTLCDPIDCPHQAPPSLGFSRQEHWSGLPFPSPMHENEN